jgi:hypothetical protein
MCYLRLLSTSTFRLREPATFRALHPRFSPVRPTSAASAAQMTFAASCCLIFGGPLHPHLHLCLQFSAASTDHCRFVCPNNTSSPQLLDFLGPLVPQPRRAGPTWLAALFAAPKLLGRSLQSRTAQRPSSSLQPRLPPGTQPGFDNLSHWLRPAFYISKVIISK